MKGVEIFLFLIYFFQFYTLLPKFHCFYLNYKNYLKSPQILRIWYDYKTPYKECELIIGSLGIELVHPTSH